MAISFFQRISRAVMGKSRVDDNTLDAVEEALVESDMGVDTTLKIIDSLEDRVARDKYMSFDELVAMLRDEISSLIDDGGEPFDFSKKPYIVLVVGVNGVGKTTTIGKLAYMLKQQGKKVILGAADTFRPLRSTSSTSGRSAQAWTSSSSPWARIPHPSRTTRRRPPSQEARTWR